MLQHLDAVAVAAAWAVALAWVAAKGAPWLLRARDDRWTMLALFAGAFALRAALPSGPINFVDGERLEAVWGQPPVLSDLFLSGPLLLAALRRAGLPVAGLLRWAGPVAGAGAVLTTYLAARAFGLRRPGAALAAAIVLAWPAHVHASTTPTSSVEAMLFWMGAFAVAAEGGAAVPWRAPLLSALATLGVYARPECRLLVVPLAALALGPGWTWRARAQLAACLVVGLGPYVPHLAPDPVTMVRSHLSEAFVPRALGDPGMSPVWWIYAAALGLAVPSKVRWNARLALALAAGLLAASYWGMASEVNPRWSQWRYYVSLVPPVAVAAAIAGEWITDRPRLTPWAPWTLVALALAPLVFYLPALRRPEDLSAEYAYLLRSAPGVVRSRPDVLILANRGHGALSNVAIEGNPAMALAAAVGPLGWPHECQHTPGAIQLRDLEHVVAECPQTVDPARAVAYLGLSRDDERLAAVRARFDLVPLTEVSLSVAPTSPVINRQCPPRDGTGYEIEGLQIASCTVRLGWYRLVPR